MLRVIEREERDFTIQRHFYDPVCPSSTRLPFCLLSPFTLLPISPSLYPCPSLHPSPPCCMVSWNGQEKNLQPPAQRRKAQKFIGYP